MSEIEGLNIRYTEESDGPFLKEWLQEKEILRWFPVTTERPKEIDHCIDVWIGYKRLKSSLTAEIDGKPCGLATLYLHPYKKIAHQCEFGIIVSPEMRNKGVGTALINNLISLAKNNFNIELLHLQVYDHNPAINLYTRFGFKEFGRQEKWIKEENGEYLARIFMEREI